MTGTTAAQAIGFALTPLISRLFSPADFGVFGSFNSVATIVAAGATLQYSQAIMLPKEKEDSLNLFFVSCFSTIAIFLLCLLFCVIAPSFINGLMKTSGALMLALLALAVLVTGLNTSCQAWCVRTKAFKQTSASQVIRSLSMSASQIGFGFLKKGSLGLIVSSILSDVLASINLIRVLLPDLLNMRRSVRWDRMKKLAKEYSDFPMYAATQNVINALSSGIPVLLLTHFYGVVAAGAYAFGSRILWVPMGVVLGALRQVLFQKGSETQNQGGSLASLYVKITVGLLLIAFFPTLVLFIWAPPLFSWIFGSEWLMAGEFAQSLILWLMFAFCNLPAVLFARLIRIQRTIFFYDMILLVIRMIVLILGGLYLKASQTILIFSLASAIMNAILILLVGRAVMKKEGEVNLENLRSYMLEG